MIRVLLADDHQVLRDGLRRSFETAGETVVAEAGDGRQAIELVMEHSPDVVLMDIEMPVLDGVEATRQLRAAGSSAKVVVLTMHDEVQRTIDAIQAGAVGFLSKGTSFADVLATVRAVAEEASDANERQLRVVAKPGNPLAGALIEALASRGVAAEAAAEIGALDTPTVLFLDDFGDTLAEKLAAIAGLAAL